MPPGVRRAKPAGEGRAEDEGLRFVELEAGALRCGGVQHRQERRVSGGDGADEVVGAVAEGFEELLEGLGGACEGGAGELFAALRAVTGAGQYGGGVVPGRLAVGFFEEQREQLGEGFALVGQGRAGAGDFGGVAAAALGAVGVQGEVGAVGLVGGRVEEADGGEHALGGEGAQQVLHLLEVAAVVVEREGAVAAHGAEILLVGQDGGGAGDFAAEFAACGMVGVFGCGCHDSPW